MGTTNLSVEEAVMIQETMVSSALTAIFRGRLCQTLFAGKKPTSFVSRSVLFETGDEDRTLLFIHRGFVKVSTVTRSGREVIFDIRKEGDVVGELSVCRPVRRYRAVALEPTEAYSIGYVELIASLQNDRELLGSLLESFCDALSHAYEQIVTMSIHETLPRVVSALMGLAKRLGQPDRGAVRISTYITQEQIAEMVAARRERVSTALNGLRRQGLVEYTKEGHLIIQLSDLAKRFPLVGAY